jgi:capsular polysaccharide biosynthesis protein
MATTKFRNLVIYTEGCQIFLVQHTKTGKKYQIAIHTIYQMTTKYTKWQ